uniref:Uncharacterized protein n=1 Tax=Anopheles darlingi TaxID=43151 RepID=A0A2M4DCD7_ANODA
MRFSCIFFFLLKTNASEALLRIYFNNHKPRIPLHTTHSPALRGGLRYFILFFRIYFLYFFMSAYAFKIIV